MSLTKAKNPFGIDISDRALRLIQLKKKGKKNIIIAKNEISLPEGVIDNGDILKSDELVRLLKKLITAASGKKIIDRQIVSVLPEKKTFVKLIEVEAESQDKIKESLLKEIPNHIPLNIDETIFDWQIIENFNSEKKFKVLIGAAPKKTVEQYLEAFKLAHLTTLALEIEAVPIARCLIDEKIEKGPKIIIDIGAMRTSLILFDHGIVQFSVNLPVSGSDITKKISETLNLDWKKAEKAKIICGLDNEKCKGALKKILISPINKIIHKTIETIDFYQEYFETKETINEIILCGGGANLLNLDKVIAEKINIPVKIGNPLKKVSINDKSINFNNNALSYTTVIGLAIRALQKNILSKSL